MSGSQLEAYLPLLLILLLGYLFLIRPARRRAQAVQQLQSALSPGDQIMLTSGIFATIVDVDAESARVELAPGVVIRVHRKAVGQIVTASPAVREDNSYDASTPPGEAPGDVEPGEN